MKKMKLTGTLKFAHQNQQFSRASEQHPSRAHIKIIKLDHKPNQQQTPNGKLIDCLRFRDKNGKTHYLVEYHKRFKHDSNSNINHNLFRFVKGTSYLHDWHKANQFIKTTGISTWLKANNKRVARNRRVNLHDFIKYGVSAKKFKKRNKKYHTKLSQYHKNYKRYQVQLKQFQQGHHSIKATKNFIKKHQPKHPSTPYGKRPFAMMTFTTGSHQTRNQIRDIIHKHNPKLDKQQLTVQIQTVYNQALLRTAKDFNTYLSNHNATVIGYNTNTDETGKSPTNKYVNTRTDGAPHLHMIIAFNTTKTVHRKRNGKRVTKRVPSFNKSKWLEQEMHQHNHKKALAQFKKDVDPIISNNLINTLQQRYPDISQFQALHFGRTGLGNGKNLSSTNYKRQQSIKHKTQQRLQQLNQTQSRYHKQANKLSHTTRKLHHSQKKLSQVHQQAKDELQQAHQTSTVTAVNQIFSSLQMNVLSDDIATVDSQQVSNNHRATSLSQAEITFHHSVSSASSSIESQSSSIALQSTTASNAIQQQQQSFINYKQSKESSLSLSTNKSKWLKNYYKNIASNYSHKADSASKKASNATSDYYLTDQINNNLSRQNRKMANQNIHLQKDYHQYQSKVSGLKAQYDKLKGDYQTIINQIETKLVSVKSDIKNYFNHWHQKSEVKHKQQLQQQQLEKWANELKKPFHHPKFHHRHDAWDSGSFTGTNAFENGKASSVASKSSSAMSLRSMSHISSMSDIPFTVDSNSLTSSEKKSYMQSSGLSR